MIVSVCPCCGYAVSGAERDFNGRMDRHMARRHPDPTTCSPATEEQLARGDRLMERRLRRITRDWLTCD